MIYDPLWQTSEKFPVFCPYDFPIIGCTFIHRFETRLTNISRRMI
jgi:hypothetical protein